MAPVSISTIITADYVERFKSLAGGSSGSAPGAALGGAAKASLSDALRFGARTYTAAVQGLNSVISTLNLGEAQLHELGQITDKLIALTERSKLGQTDDALRSRLDRQFRKLSREFQDILESAEVGGREYLTEEGLKELFKVFGLDERSSQTIAEVLNNFKTPRKDDSFASEYEKGKRPVPLPPVTVTTTTVIPGGPDGTFGGAADYTVDPFLGLARRPQLADVNNDGELDIVSGISGYSGDLAVAVQLGNGDGTFNAASVTYSTMGNAAYVRTGDFNEDGRADAALFSTSNNRIETYLGQADGSMIYNTGFWNGASSSMPGDAAVADLDQDGNDDIIVHRYGTPSIVSVFWGDGTGGFSAGTDINTASGMSGNTGAMQIADINGDTELDIIAADTAGTFSVITGAGARAFNAPTTFTTGPFNAGPEGTAMAVADFDGDGDLDVASGTTQYPKIFMNFNDGTGAFTTSAVVTVTGVEHIMQLQAEDMNNDGDVDLVTQMYFGAIEVLINNGNGTFTASSSQYTYPGTYTYFDIADLDGDGAKDIVYGANTSYMSVRMGGIGPDTIVNNTTSGGIGTAREFDRIFDSNRGIRRRADAYKMLEDLKAMRRQIDTNISAIKNAMSVVGKNVDLVRATGLALLEVADQVTNENADQVAALIRKQILANAPGALSQAENLEPITVASLAFDRAASSTE